MESFRDYIRGVDDPKVKGIDQYDAYTWAEKCFQNPRVGPVFAAWKKSLEEEGFIGISSDGTVREDLFQLDDNVAPVEEIRKALVHALEVFSDAELEIVSHPVDSKVRRAWMNPEVYMNRFGLRLDEIDVVKRKAILDVLSASLSERGYSKVTNLLKINEFLGEVVGAPRVLNKDSYNFNVFGDCQKDEVWGWNFYGHHVCLNCTVVRNHLVITPVFFGAEPVLIDAGNNAGITELKKEERLGLELVRSLPDEVSQHVVLYTKKLDEKLPVGRNVIADELILGGAFQDNRVIPYEGACVNLFPSDSKSLLIELIATYFEYLPEGVFAKKMEEVGRHLDQTFFCWIGGTDDVEPFYYRIQSPVLFIEFDHHAGVFLSNTEAKRFHIHTVIRTPNGNDYGRALAKCCSCSGVQKKDGV